MTLQISQPGVRDSHNLIGDIYYQVIDILKLILIRDVDICNFHSVLSKCNYRYLELVLTRQNDVLDICNDKLQDRLPLQVGAEQVVVVVVQIIILLNLISGFFDCSQRHDCSFLIPFIEIRKLTHFFFDYGDKGK